MTGIDVATTRTDGGWTCRVTVHATTPTDHAVRVTQRDLDTLDSGATDPTDLVRRAFEFLLEREPNTSILPEFDLPVIGRYFPRVRIPDHFGSRGPSAARQFWVTPTMTSSWSGTPSTRSQPRTL